MKSKLIIFGIAAFFSSLSLAAEMPATPSAPPIFNKTIPTLNNAATPETPTIIPAPPNIDATGYMLIDANSGYIIAEKNPHQEMAPASLTKLMNLYLVFSALKSGQISLDSNVTISKTAWQTGGSRMFLNPGTQVPVQKLIEGVVVDSGNDAATALAQFVGGTQANFVSMMNQTAQALDMQNTHFEDPTGLPTPNHYSSPYDLAILTRAIIQDFPEYYHFFQQKWLTYDNIKQANRNLLLWRDPSVDGLKTGDTKEAGYCLIASAVRDGMRLIAVVMGTPTFTARDDDDEALLNYGYRFFQTEKLFSANTAIDKSRVYFGQDEYVPVGVAQDLYVTVPKGEFKNVKTKIELNGEIKAPIQKGQILGKIVVNLQDKQIGSQNLIALSADPTGSALARLRDHIALMFHHSK